MSERSGGNPVRATGAPASTKSVPFGPGSPLRARSARSAWGQVGTLVHPSATDHLLRLRTSDSFPFGIEEEFFLIDAATKSTVLTRPPGSSTS